MRLIKGKAFGQFYSVRNWSDSRRRAAPMFQATSTEAVIHQAVSQLKLNGTNYSFLPLYSRAEQP